MAIATSRPARVVPLSELRRLVDLDEVIRRMRDCFVAYSDDDCQMPAPMQLNFPDLHPTSEVHIKSAYRKGGPFFAIKMAGVFGKGAEPTRPNGVILLYSASTGELVLLLEDEGHLTDVRTAAATVVVAAELGRKDRTIGILGSGIQARLQPLLHARRLPLERVVLWGRRRSMAEKCAEGIRADTPSLNVEVVDSPAEVAGRARLIVTATSAREALLRRSDLQPGTHISAVGADAPGKQELDPRILADAELVLVDSLSQTRTLGELQHSPGIASRAIEVGAFCRRPRSVKADAISVCDLTGLGIQDLAIAKSVAQRLGVPASR